MKKIYMGDNDHAEFFSLFIKREALLMVGRRLVTILCTLNYSPKLLSSPIFKGFVLRAVEAEKAFAKKREELIEKYCEVWPIPFCTINVAIGTLALRDEFTQTIVKDLVAEVGEEYQGMLRRYNFIISRGTDNICFLFMRCLYDENDSFFDLSVVKKHMERIENAVAEKARLESGVAAIIFDDESVELAQHIVYSRECEKVRVII